jgi:hypothetical protein
MKESAIRLRENGRLPTKTIARLLGVSNGTAIKWLRNHPLTKEEQLKAVKDGGTASGKKNHPKDRGNRSKFFIDQPLTNERKGRIAEAAVLFRLALYGFEVYEPAFDDESLDLIIRRNKLIKLQVRWASEDKRYGLPFIRLRCSDGRGSLKRYDDGDFDFMVGYDLFTDIAYVFSREEIKNNKSSVTIKPETAERWDKIK